ncbi:MAG: BMP family lipoprotein [Candidatus Hadarchaeota archaeon]
MRLNKKGLSNAAVVLIIAICVAVVAVGAYMAFFESDDDGTTEVQGKIGLVLATGGLGDRSFNDQSFWAAEDGVEDFDFELDHVEPDSVAEFETYQRQFAREEEYDLIVCVGFDQAAALENVASDYPDQDFAIVDGHVEGANNVASLLFNDWEEAFLAGVVAGEMTETNKIGIEGGMDIDLINNFVMGYRQGALWTNSEMGENDVIVKYVGDWSDVTTGKALAEDMYDDGADIIYGSAGRSHLGVFESAEERSDALAIGTDVDQAWSAPEYSDVIIASALKRVDVSVYDQIDRKANDEFEPGVYNYGMAPDSVGVGTGIAIGEENINEYIRSSASEVEIPDEVIDKVEEAVEKIRDGTIEIDHL